MSLTGKLVIIGLDGLDYKLASKWRVNKLMLSFNGEFYVGDIERLYTPIIWSSILCGFNVAERGYGYSEAIERSMGLLRIAYRVKKKIMPKRSTGFVRDILAKLGLLKANFTMPQSLRRESFLETLAMKGYRVKAIEVPGYNERVNGRYRLRMSRLALEKNMDSRIKFIEEVKRDCTSRFREAMESLGDYDLIMCYTPLPDLAHHLFHYGLASRVRMYSLYKWIENQVYKNLIKPSLEENYEVMILSDHGFIMEQGVHSKYAFWSTTFKPPVDVESYRDIKKIVLSIMGA